MVKRTFVVCMIGLLTNVDAAIQTNGKWTGHDHCEPSNVGICYKNGIPVSKTRERELKAAMGIDGIPSNW